MQWLGIDSGGTFTDFVLLDGDSYRLHKVLSTPHAPQHAILQGIHDLGVSDSMRTGQLRIIHGTTVATNAALEGKGASTLLITQRGLEDVIKIGRQQRSELYNLTPRVLQTPLSQLPVIGISARLDHQGNEIAPLSDEDMSVIDRAIDQHRPEAVAVCLLFSYLNPVHEQAIAKHLHQRGLAVSCSYNVLPTQGEFERSMATWLNAWLGPKVSNYLEALDHAIAPAPLSIMQSNGGTIDARAAANEAVNLLLSGPAGGLAAALRLGQQIGQAQLMTFDMGGTSTDVALLDGGVSLTQKGHIGPYPVATPMVDMHTIGAGGGSIADVDPAGMLHVGPESAGADPGPACYGKGGQAVTVTDANLVLGRLHPSFLLGDHLALQRGAAEDAMGRLAEQLNCSLLDAARGVIDLANEHMTQALRVISIQDGHDPKAFSLVSFGGAGGLHVCALADNLGMTNAIVPSRAGVFSAEGLICAPKKRQHIQALPAEIDLQEVQQLADRLAGDCRDALLAEGLSEQTIHISQTLQMCYKGQSSTLDIPWQADLQALTDTFHRQHAHRFGHRLALPVSLVNIRVEATGNEPVPTPKVPPSHRQPPTFVEMADETGPVPVYRRDHLAIDQSLDGPAIVAESVGTTWLAPGWRATVHPLGHLLLSRTRSRDHDQ